MFTKWKNTYAQKIDVDFQKHTEILTEAISEWWNRRQCSFSLYLCNSENHLCWISIASTLSKGIRFSSKLKSGLESLLISVQGSCIQCALLIFSTFQKGRCEKMRDPSRKVRPLNQRCLVPMTEDPDDGFMRLPVLECSGALQAWDSHSREPVLSPWKDLAFWEGSLEFISLCSRLRRKKRC
jgi:hypothetical protein